MTQLAAQAAGTTDINKSALRSTLYVPALRIDVGASRRKDFGNGVASSIRRPGPGRRCWGFHCGEAGGVALEPRITGYDEGRSDGGP